MRALTLFVRVYDEDDYERTLQEIHDDIKKGHSQWCGLYDLPGLCAACGAASYPELAKEIRESSRHDEYWYWRWIQSSGRIALFEGRYIGFDPDRYLLFKPTRLTAIVENIYSISGVKEVTTSRLRR